MLLAEAAEKVQTLFVHSKKSSLRMEFGLPLRFRENVSLEKTRIYSWTSRSTGFAADIQLPHAVDEPALEPLSQMSSPRI